MGYLREKVAYLRGLAEGMQLDDSTKEGKLLKEILEVLDDFALAIEDVEEIQDQMGEQLDIIDEDLSEVERAVFDEDDEDDILYFKEIECPYCNEKIDVDIDMLDEGGTTIKCPGCGRDIEVEWDCCCDDDVDDDYEDEDEDECDECEKE